MTKQSSQLTHNIYLYFSIVTTINYNCHITLARLYIFTRKITSNINITVSRIHLRLKQYHYNYYNSINNCS